ncbi:hypothetical protein AB0L41_24620 [Amycolatopsis mediterranei]|uniref:hypothetical protein n=1 Tax=Amycolatopsis mediterranei TaxID=33910 RepID=UPI003444DA00
MASDHERRVSGPRFAIVAEAVKPFGQECSIAKWTEQLGRFGAVVGALPEPAAEFGALVRLRSVDGGVAEVWVALSETGLAVREGDETGDCVVLDEPADSTVSAEPGEDVPGVAVAGGSDTKRNSVGGGFDGLAAAPITAASPHATAVTPRATAACTLLRCFVGAW